MPAYYVPTFCMQLFAITVIFVLAFQRFINDENVEFL